MGRTPSPPAPGGIRAERDKLIRDNDALRDQCAKMKDELVDLTSTLVSFEVLPGVKRSATQSH